MADPTTVAGSGFFTLVTIVIKHIFWDSKISSAVDATATVLSNKIDTEKENRQKLESKLLAIETIIDDVRANYVPRKEFTEIRLEIKADIKELENRLLAAISTLRRAPNN